MLLSGRGIPYTFVVRVLYLLHFLVKMSVEEWLGDLDSQFIVYAPHLMEMGFTSSKMMKFLKLKDLMKMPCNIPAPHRRMILNAVSKLQTPESKAKENVDTPDSDDHVISKKQKKENLCCGSSNATTSNFEPRKLFGEQKTLASSCDTTSKPVDQTQKQGKRKFKVTYFTPKS